MPRKHRTTKQKLRRTLAILIALFLGWMAADIAFEQVPNAAYGATAPATGEKDAKAHDDHVHSVEALKVEKSYWFGKVVAGAVLLFVGAAVLGPLVLSLKGPDPIERDDHAHDDHAHDAHGKDAHAAHGHADKAPGHGH